MRLNDFDDNPLFGGKKQAPASPLNVGDFVMVVSTGSLPAEYLGNYGLITEKREGGKVRVEFGGKIGPIASLNHIGRERDLKKVGQTVHTSPPDEK